MIPLPRPRPGTAAHSASKACLPNVHWTFGHCERSALPAELYPQICGCPIIIFGQPLIVKYLLAPSYLLGCLRKDGISTLSCLLLGALGEDTGLEPALLLELCELLLL